LANSRTSEKLTLHLSLDVWDRGSCCCSALEDCQLLLLLLFMLLLLLLLLLTIPDIATDPLTATLVLVLLLLLLLLLVLRVSRDTGLFCLFTVCSTPRLLRVDTSVNSAAMHGWRLVSVMDCRMASIRSKENGFGPNRRGLTAFSMPCFDGA